MDSISVTSYDMDQSYSKDSHTLDSGSVTSYDMDQSCCSFSINDSPSVIYDNTMDSASVTSYDMDQSYSSFSLNDSPSVICGHHLVVDDDSTVVSAFYHDEVDEDDSDGLDDTALSDLINKLRNGGSSNKQTEESREEAEGKGAAAAEEDEREKEDEEESQGSDEDLTDDVIAKHLKALNRTTKKRSKYNVIDDDNDVSDTEAVSTVLDEEEMSYLTEAMDGDSSDEEEEDEDAYAEVDEMMKKLGVESTDNEQNRKWLETMSQQGAYDFVGGPQTVSSKKKWLVSLAAELMLEDSSDDDSDGSIEKQDVDDYEVNMKQLEKAAQEAQMLICNTEQDAKVRASAGKAPRDTRIKSGASRRQPRKTNEWQKRQWKKNNTAPIQFPVALRQEHRFANPQQRPGTVPSSASASRRKSFSMSQASKRMNPSLFPRKQLLAVPEEEEPSQPGLHSEVRPSADHDPVLIRTTVKPAATPNTADIKPAKNTAAKPAATPNTAQDTKRSVVTTGQSKEKPIGAGLETSTAKQNSQNHADDSKNTPIGPNVDIPPGFPPYPGFGPKWPWHPNSPRAPAGYRECYMLHMGEFYHQYMEYLQARAGSLNSEAKSEQILRASLSSQATFKPLSKKTKDKLSKYSIYRSSKPLSARKNSVVPILKPKTKTDDTPSNSSGSSANAEGLIDLIKTKPDVVAVGRIHKKSKGKKGKVILISGNELDKQAKEEEKKNKKRAAEASSETEKTTKENRDLDVRQEKTNSNSKLTTTSAHSDRTKNSDRKNGKVDVMTGKDTKTNAQEEKSKVTAFPEQPAVAATNCSCVIM